MQEFDPNVQQNFKPPASTVDTFKLPQDLKKAIEEIIDQRVTQIVKQYVDPLVSQLQTAIAKVSDNGPKENLQRSFVKPETFKKRKTSERSSGSLGSLKRSVADPSNVASVQSQYFTMTLKPKAKKPNVSSQVSLSKILPRTKTNPTTFDRDLSNT